MAAASAKILTIGPPSGRIPDLIAKITAIQSKHGPFASLFVLGHLFTPSPAALTQPELDLLAAKLLLPIPTYFFLGPSPLPSEVQARIDDAQQQQPRQDGKPFKLAENLFYLGKSGVCETEHGFTVAFSGGAWDAAKWAQSLQRDAHANHDNHDLTLPYVTSQSVHRLLSHPCFALPKPPTAAAAASAAATPAARTSPGGEPQTLAAARAQAKAAAAVTAAATENASLLNSRPPLDFLLTNYWPAGVSLFSTAALPDDTARMWGCAPLANVAKAGAPRYHFALAPGPSSEDATPIVGLKDELREIGAFWEREPYVNDLKAAFGVAKQAAQGHDQGWATPRAVSAATATSSSGESITRFISLARFANAKKARWFMALNLTPASSSAAPPPPKPANTTTCPYFSSTGAAGKRPTDTAGAADEELEARPNFRFSEDRKRRRTNAPGGGERDDGPPPPGYKCRICGSEEHYIRLCPEKGANANASAPRNGARPASASTNGTAPAAPTTLPGLAGLPSRPSVSFSGARRQRLLPIGPEDCWFCLSNPQCAKHLILSLGEETYLALSKGPLTSSSTSPVPGGGHVLIVPMSHFGSLLETDIDIARDTLDEMEETKKRLKKCFNKYGAGMVSWEVGKSSKSGSRVGHTMSEVVSIVGEISLGDMLEVFGKRAEETKMDFVKDKEEVEKFLLDIRNGKTEAEGEGQGEGWDYMILGMNDRSGEEGKWLVKTKGSRWSVQFVRQTLASLLSIPDRADWKRCVREEDQERKDVLAFREALNHSDILEGER